MIGLSKTVIQRLVAASWQSDTDLEFNDRHPTLDLDGFNSACKIGFVIGENRVNCDGCRILNIPSAKQTNRKVLLQFVTEWIYSVWFDRQPAEVQKHGFTWETELLTKVYKITPADKAKISYTSKIDLPAEFNKLDGCNVSIKTTKSPNTVCMADCLSLFDEISSGVPFHLIVIQYKQMGVNKQLTGITELNLTGKKELLFGSLSRAQIERLSSMIKKVKPGRCPNEEKTKINALRDTLNQASRAIRLNVKIDSKSQRRLQCSFNKFQAFVSDNQKLVVEKSNNGCFKGGSITPIIHSKQRSFNK